MCVFIYTYYVHIEIERERAAQKIGFDSLNESEFGFDSLRKGKRDEDKRKGRRGKDRDRPRAPGALAEGGGPATKKALWNFCSSRVSPRKTATNKNSTVPSSSAGGPRKHVSCEIRLRIRRKNRLCEVVCV